MKKIYNVYFKKLPVAVADLPKKDKNIILKKDGVFTFGNMRCPRLTLSIELFGKYDEPEKIKKITMLLNELEENNQIIGFSERYSS